MKKLASLLLLGMSGLSIAGNYDFSSLTKMDMYEAFVVNSFGNLVIQEAEKQNGAMNPAVKKVMLEALESNESLSQIRNECWKILSDKCMAEKVDKEITDKLSEHFQKMENAFQNDGISLWVKEDSLDKYKNMTLAQLGRLSKKTRFNELQPLIANEYGNGKATIVMMTLEMMGMCDMKGITANDRRKMMCDVTLDVVLPQL